MSKRRLSEDNITTKLTTVDKQIKKIKFVDEVFTTLNLNMYVHNGYINNSIGFINQINNHFDINKFFVYFIKEVCSNTNSQNIVYKYMQIIDGMRVQIELFGINDIYSIMIYFLNKFNNFYQKLSFVDKLESEIAECIKTKKDFDSKKLVSKLKEQIVIDNLLILKKSELPICNKNQYYIDLIEELEIYRGLIKTQGMEESINYVKGFYSIYLTMLMDIMHNIDKIKSFEELFLEYDIKFLHEFEFKNINDIVKIFNKLELDKNIQFIRMII